MAIKFEGRYPTGPNGERLPSYQVAVGCDVVGTPEQRAAAAADLKKFMTPAPVNQIERWLVELDALTAGRGKEGISAELTLSAYSSRLTQFPADVVKHALLVHTWKWFPAWAELEAVCKSKASPRQHMIAALSKPSPNREPVRRPPTEMERANIQALVDELFPRQPKEDREKAVQETLRGKCMAGNPAREGRA